MRAARSLCDIGKGEDDYGGERDRCAKGLGTSFSLQGKKVIKIHYSEEETGFLLDQGNRKQVTRQERGRKEEFG